MKIFIFGNQGNMGKRYTAILKYLGHEPYGMDAGDHYQSHQKKLFRIIDGYIIATPSHTHLSFLEYLVDCQKPVLCEKPIVNDSKLEKLNIFLGSAKRSGMQLSMVSQYDYCIPKFETLGDTSYNFYKSGNDGLAWDCINIIWHAKGRISLSDQSPIWSCKINGRDLDLSRMDFAYIDMIKDWIHKPYEPQYERILNSHKKVLEYLDGKFT